MAEGTKASLEGRIRNDYSLGLSYRELSKIYHKSFSALSSILKGHSTILPLNKKSSKLSRSSYQLPPNDSVHRSHHLFQVIGEEIKQGPEYRILKRLELSPAFLDYITTATQKNGFGNDICGFLKQTIAFYQVWHDFALDHLEEKIRGF